MEYIEIEAENPMEKSVMERWLKCSGKIGAITDRSASGYVLLGVAIQFVPKQDELLPSPPDGPAQTKGEPGFRG